MNTILASIQPKWCELIANKKKTIEVRKSVPKCGVPFKVYIYCTYGQCLYADYPHGVGSRINKFAGYNCTKKSKPSNALNGKVIGEFICDGILSHCESSNADLAEQQGWIKREKLFEYSNGKELYGWHISDLKIYDKPKELSEFERQCPDNADCHNCDNWYWGNYMEPPNCGCDGYKPITRPPQSYFYVEEGAGG